MEKDNTRLLVIGAGVNGSICAVGLQNAGINATVLARGKRYEELRDEGIIIEDPLKNTRTVTRVPVIDSLKPDDIYDYILVVVRKNQVPALLPVLAKNKSPNVVFMINNPTGPDEFIRALGASRVMLGFVFAGGKRDGDIIRAIQLKKSQTPFGEVNGATTPRLERLVSILQQAGFHAVISDCIVDWLATHAALVAPIGNLVLQYNCDNYALARSTADLNLVIDAMRETIAVLQANGRKITPPSTKVYQYLPKFVLVMIFRKLLSSRLGEIGIAWHCSQAPDEIRQLSRELLELVEKSKLPSPAIRKIIQLV